MPTPISERKLANAIRVLSFDAVQKPTLDIRVRQWVWLISPRFCGASFEAQSR